MSSCKSHDRPIDILDYRHVMSAILYIYENGPTKRSDVYMNVSRNSNMPDRINFLVDMGIVSEIVSIGGMRLSLTDVGIGIAEHLKGIEDQLGDRI